MMPLLALSAVLALAGCGGGESTEPLALAQRVVLEEDAPGSKPDPVEKGSRRPTSMSSSTP